MLIEILTRDMDKKAEILTFLAGEDGFHATGDQVRIEGLLLTIGENFLLFQITSWECGEKVVQLLFSVVPNAYSPAYYEPVSGQKVLVTALALPLLEIIPALDSIEHIDLEAGELAGKYVVQWQSRDVVITAAVDLMVQGGVANARIIFRNHFRESEFHCRACVGQVSLREVLSRFTQEVRRDPPPPVVGPIEITGQVSGTPEGWFEFINNCGQPVRLANNGQALEVLLGNGSLIFQHKSGTELSGVDLRLTDPEQFTPALAKNLTRFLGFRHVQVSRIITGAVFDLTMLMCELGFRKEKEFAVFARDGEFRAIYEGRCQELRLGRLISLQVAPVAVNEVRQLFRDMENFTRTVMAYVL